MECEKNRVPVSSCAHSGSDRVQPGQTGGKRYTFRGASAYLVFGCELLRIPLKIGIVVRICAGGAYPKDGPYL